MECVAQTLVETRFLSYDGTDYIVKGAFYVQAW